MFILQLCEGQQKRGKTSKEIFHESAGWRHLETSMNALKRLFELNKQKNLLKRSLFDLLQGTILSYSTVRFTWHSTCSDWIVRLNYLISILLNCWKECSSHSNRFIRENSFYICSAVLNETLNSAPELIDDFAKLIYKGLSDNWSQVRMSSSAAGRERINFYLWTTEIPELSLDIKTLW